MGKLTTHVLDAMHGKPAAGMKIDLYRVEREGPCLLTSVVTNADGRLDEALLEGADLLVGVYELLFHVGEFFANHGGDIIRPRFLDLVPIRFGVAAADQNYHVPLVCSRWSYSTYRGS